ncbi:MAG: tRNA (adenosine(37)-N6)-dimethylallyltransferase MiaA [Cytophagaceae bacterium]
MKPPKLLIVVAGPTAVGKTDLCIELAKRYHTEIISADSRQLFKEMSIGTAKPEKEEMQGVPHHFINSYSVQDEYNAGRFELDTLNLLQTLFKKYDQLILTGGSGLYIKAVCEGFDELPDVDPYIREGLIQSFHEDGLDNLLDELKQKDPVYYDQVDRANHQRVIRALEIIRGTGMPFSFFRKRKVQPRPFTILKIGLERPRAELYQRIDHRMDLMLEKGLLEEAKALYPFKHLNALQTVGYQEIFDFLDGKYDWDEAVRLLKRNSRRYAKRQMTWFNRDLGFKWFSPENPQDIIEYINSQIKKSDV